MSSIREIDDGYHCKGTDAWNKFGFYFNIMIPPRLIRTISVPSGTKKLAGELSIPPNAFAIVVFAHGSGSSRQSPRNQMVARYLNNDGFATLLFDLLTPDEYTDFAIRFNIPLLSQRLKDVTLWLADQKECRALPIGYFGASTGAAAALNVAAELPKIAAIVSRGGRPDLAMEALPLVKAPTLLIVGGSDTDVIRLNEKAFALLHCTKKMEIVPGATHLFEERGAMEKVCALATAWFEKNLQCSNATVQRADQP